MLTREGLERVLPAVRPALVQAARRLRRCNRDDAEDIVSETVLIALRRLHVFEGEPTPVAVRRWLYGILRHQVQGDVRTCSHRLDPEAHARAELALRQASPSADTDPSRLMEPLPYSLRGLLKDWLAGYSLREMAKLHRISLNRAGARLSHAFEILRNRFQDADSLSASLNLFVYCSRVTIYRKPTGVWPYWNRRHPGGSAPRAVRNATHRRRS